MKRLLLIALVLDSCLSIGHAATAADLAAPRGLIQRITPEHSTDFVCESLPERSGRRDCVEIESRGDSLLVAQEPLEMYAVPGAH